jgi:hypothetical protein
MSLGKLSYWLQALIGKGWIKIGNFSRRANKKGYVAPPLVGKAISLRKL